MAISEDFSRVIETTGTMLGFATETNMRKAEIDLLEKIRLRQKEFLRSSAGITFAPLTTGYFTESGYLLVKETDFPGLPDEWRREVIISEGEDGRLTIDSVTEKYRTTGFPWGSIQPEELKGKSRLDFLKGLLVD